MTLCSKCLEVQCECPPRTRNIALGETEFWRVPKSRCSSDLDQLQNMRIPFNGRLFVPVRATMNVGILGEEELTLDCIATRDGIHDAHPTGKTQNGDPEWYIENLVSFDVVEIRGDKARIVTTVNIPGKDPSVSDRWYLAADKNNISLQLFAR